MAKRSNPHRRSSSTPTGSFHQFGCMGNLLHFFDFHQHLHIRRMLMMDRKHDAGKLSTGTKHVRNKPSSSKHGFLDSVANFAMEYNSTENSNGNAPRTRASVDEEMAKVSSAPKHKQFPSRMRRTFSIHHLDCDDYVLQDTTTDSEATSESFHQYDTNSSASTEEVSLLLDAPHEACGSRCGDTDESIVNTNGVDHNQPDEFSRYDSVDKQTLLQEKLNEAKSHANELRENFKVNRAKSFLDALELFNANREMFLKIIQDPNSLSEKYLQYLQDSSMDRTLLKCDSNPESGSSGQDIMRMPRHGHRRTETEPSNRSELGHFFTNFDENLNSVGSSELSMHNYHKPRGHRNDDSCQYHLKDTKKRIKDMIKESKSGKHWISMDGVLHRVPYGHKLSYQVLGQGSSSSGKKYGAPRFRKSLSLTESLDRYSSLLGSPLGIECKKQESNRSQLFQQDGILLVKNSSKTLKRIRSLPDFTTSSGKDAQCEVPEVISFLRKPSQAMPFSRTPSVNLGEPNSDINFDISEELNKPVDILANIKDEAYPESDNVTENECHVEVTENTASIADVLDELREEIVINDPLLHDLDGGSESDLSSDLDKTSQAPDSNKYLQENSISQSISLSEVHPEWEGSSDHYSDELDSKVYSKNQIIPETFHADQTVRETISKISRPNTPNLTALRLQPSSNKDEAEFNYVIDILKKSGFSGNEFLGRWYSPDLPLDPSLFEELEGLNCGIDTGSDDESSVNLDHLLLFDLINEVLLEICESSSAINPWLLRFNNRPLRPVHVGSHDLEEVWETISWHLSFHPEENPTVEYVVRRDLTETDKWMNTGYQTDDISAEIEEMVLENLLDEAILELF